MCNCRHTYYQQHPHNFGSESAQFMSAVQICVCKHYMNPVSQSLLSSAASILIPFLLAHEICSFSRHYRNHDSGKYWIHSPRKPWHGPYWFERIYEQPSAHIPTPITNTEIFSAFTSSNVATKIVYVAAQSFSSSNFSFQHKHVDPRSINPIKSSLNFKPFGVTECNLFLYFLASLTMVS